MSTVRQDVQTCDTTHHASKTQYPLHDGKPAVVSSTAELINPSREITEERKKRKKRKKES